MQELALRTLVRFQNRAARLHRDQAGAGVLEYALVAAVVSVALVSAALTFGQSAVNSATTQVAGVLP